MGHHGHYSTCLSFHWDSWLSETVKNRFLSHLIPSSLEHHHDFENWYSGQLFILIYCSDCFANNKRSVFSLQWPARWIKGENISFNSRNFGGTKLREVTDSQNLWNVLLQMIKWEETREIIFCEQQILKNMKTIFYEKKSFLKSKDVKIRVQIFFFWISSDLFSWTPGFEEFRWSYFREFSK